MRLYSDIDLHLDVLYSILKPPTTLHMFDRAWISLSCESRFLTNNAGSCACLCTLSVSECRYIQLLMDVLTQLLCSLSSGRRFKLATYVMLVAA